MNSCQLLIVKTPATRLLQVTTPVVLKVSTPATMLLQQQQNLLLKEQTKPTLLLQSKGGPAGPQGPAGTSGKPIITRDITSDLTVLPGTTCLHNQTRIALGVSVRVEDTGRLYIL